MTEEEYARRKRYAGPTKPSMHRRRIGHDYSSRRMYLITMTVERRQPLLGTLKGTITGIGPEGCSAQVLPSPLGRRVQEEWYAVTAHHPEVAVIAFQLMPDHVHGILFVRAAMNQHLGTIISGFKAETNRAYRELYGATAAAPPHSQPATSAAAVGAAAVGCAAASPQRKRDRSHENRHHGLLWSPGYNDHVLSNEGELERWRQYVADNPRRLFLRRQHPELFRVHFGVRIGRFDCTAVGNCFLLEYPQRRQVQHSTHLYEDDIQKAVADNMAAARGGAVLVSPSISEGEKRSMRAAFDAGLPLILITANGLGLYTKPDGAFFDACAEGRLLVVSPFEHQNRKVTLTRQMCMEMNELARLIAEGSDAAADNNPRTKNNETEVIINGLSGLVNDNERSKEPRD